METLVSNSTPIGVQNGNERPEWKRAWKRTGNEAPILETKRQYWKRSGNEARNRWKRNRPKTAPKTALSFPCFDRSFPTNHHHGQPIAANLHHWPTHPAPAAPAAPSLPVLEKANRAHRRQIITTGTDNAEGLHTQPRIKRRLKRQQMRKQPTRPPQPTAIHSHQAGLGTGRNDCGTG
jgi:hypothetical protein